MAFCGHFCVWSLVVRKEILPNRNVIPSGIWCNQQISDIASPVSVRRSTAAGFRQLHSCRIINNSRRASGAHALHSGNVVPGRSFNCFEDVESSCEFWEDFFKMILLPYFHWQQQQPDTFRNRECFFVNVVPWMAPKIPVASRSPKSLPARWLPSQLVFFINKRTRLPAHSNHLPS